MRRRDDGWKAYQGHGEPRVGYEAALGGRFLLAQALTEGVPPPDEMEAGVLLRGAVHFFYGDTSEGKTWAALWLIAQALLRGERVVYFDAENGQRITTERLGELGVDPETVDRLLWYFPLPTLDEQSESAYHAMLSDVRPDLIVFDALANFLGSAGLEESSNDDLIAWATTYTRPARARGITIAVLDHCGHDDSRMRGASRKDQEADVVWAVRTVKAFDRDRVGEMRLIRRKDREAWLPESLKFSVGGSPEGFVFRRSSGTVQPQDSEGLTRRDRDVLGVLRDRFPEGARSKEWEAACNEPPLKLSRATFHRSLQRLKKVSPPLILEAPGEGNRETYYRAVPGPDNPGGETSRETNQSPIGKPNHGRSQQVSKRSHRGRETDAPMIGLNRSHTPIRGETGETYRHETDHGDPLAALLDDLTGALGKHAAIAAQDPARHAPAFTAAIADALGDPQKAAELRPRVVAWLEDPNHREES